MIYRIYPSYKIPTAVGNYLGTQYRYLRDNWVNTRDHIEYLAIFIDCKRQKLNINVTIN